MDDKGHVEMSVYNKICCIKSNKKYCVLIIIMSNHLDVNVISHESTHAARFIWEWLAEKKRGIEADAYLVGYIADCIDQVRKGKFKQ